MANEWHPDFLPQKPATLESVGGVPSDRALQNTSGNIQSYSDSIAHHSNAASHDDYLQQLAFKYPHPVPAPCDLHSRQALAKLQHRKVRRVHSVGPGGGSSRRQRTYLQSPKYLEYRARPRRDTGKDGEAVWSDELEDAFQQGKNILLIVKGKDSRADIY